ncbi:hypothetical protein GCM10010384_56510 [Streptomyces djakartensis]|uniref:4Fe-4S Mo/W bis-MGD-type domain-containing protein n=1 Tax=Streptomyces djakartensis TaxID=68193 RepID=A0ABQ3A9M4_9ACTN|nr:hypothetical protein GCM10010384_56510 [Streptomyces djakartensis]
MPPGLRTAAPCRRHTYGSGVGCDLTPHVRDNETVKVTSPHDDPVPHCDLRIKGRFGHRHIQNRD